VNALSDEVIDKQVLVGSSEKEIPECKEIIEAMQLSPEKMVDDYKDKLTEATEEIYVSESKRVFHPMLSTSI
jgi:predicted nucleic acid-binding protein